MSGGSGFPYDDYNGQSSDFNQHQRAIHASSNRLVTQVAGNRPAAVGG